MRFCPLNFLMILIISSILLQVFVSIGIEKQLDWKNATTKELKKLRKCYDWVRNFYREKIQRRESRKESAEEQWQELEGMPFLSVSLYPFLMAPFGKVKRTDNKPT